MLEKLNCDFIRHVFLYQPQMTHEIRNIFMQSDVSNAAFTLGIFIKFLFKFEIGHDNL